MFPTENSDIPLHFHCYVSLPEGRLFFSSLGGGGSGNPKCEILLYVIDPGGPLHS